MKNFKLSGLRLVELVSVVDSIQPKDLGDLKSIRLCTHLVTDMKACLKELAEKNDALALKQKGFATPFQEKYQKESEALTDEQKKELAARLDKELKEVLEKELGEEQKVMTELLQQEMAVELSDEKFDKLQELFKKYSAEKYLNKEILIQVADALMV